MCPADSLVFVVGRHRFITVVIQNRNGVDEGPHFAVTLHRVEMKKLVQAIQAAMDAPVELEIKSFGGTEGVYLGGPPGLDQIMAPSMGLPAPKESGSEGGEG